MAARYLSCLGVLLQLVQLCIAALEEALQDRMIVEAALSPDQIHAFAQLSNIQQHVFQRDFKESNVSAVTVSKLI